ncbi:bone morphogenetic protein 8A-like isoform X1 [Acipenser ruthenus]|uniref:bone morphogenetic protein 8A-like isoform X1 n=1 Tax=Acipenser ruthenus TaxID=7906 RepID=UPI002741B2F3|nr:bone morphogenetic protein 8A-like isoform X1 [Acipenser ruthenus]
MAPSRATGRDGARVSLPLSLVLLCAFSSLWDACGGSFLSNSLHPSFIDRRLSGREKREMQREILSILGLPGRPRPHLPVRPPSSAPLFMLDLYHAVAPQERDGAGVSWAVQTPPLGDVISEADTVMSFVNVVEQERDPLHPRPYWKEFRFDLTPIPQGEAVTAAEFRIYKAHSYGHRGNRTLHISVYEIVKEHTNRYGRGGSRGHTNRESDLLLLDLQQVHAGDEGWLVFDVATASNRWLLNPRSNLGLRLYVETDEEHSVEPGSVGLVGRKGPRSKQPFMVTFFRQSQPGLRLPRGIRHNRKKHRGRTYDLPHPNKLPGLLDHNHISDGRHVCKRHELYVSFSELGWKDWVIAPQGYSAYYCDGECSYPLGSCMNATNHAIMQLVVHMLKPDEVPKACCAPTKLSPISVLFYDDNNNVILKKHRNMVVKACGCH